MKTPVLYTVISLFNLIGFAVGVCLLPATVPIHFDWSMTADTVGSPWVYLALPAAAALISPAVWTVVYSKKEKNKALIIVLLAAVGALLAYLGWIFFALVASGAEVGEKAAFPVMLAVFLPLSLFLLFLGAMMPHAKPNRVFGIRTPATLASEEVWRATHRLGGLLTAGAGALSAVLCVVFSCTAVPDYAIPVFFCALLLVACAVPIVYAEVRRRAESGRMPPEGKE